jgi:nucleotide sugar dehydrogenase
MKKSSVIGIGRLGLCWALNLEHKGYDVLGIDIDEKYVETLNNKTFNSKEPFVDEYLRKSKNFKATTDISAAIKHSNILYIVVATNTLEDGHYDHSIIDSIVDNLILLGKQVEQKHIILQSTTIPGYCDSIEKRLNEYNYTLSYNPEFIRQGTIIEDQLQPDMVLIGCTNPSAKKILLEAYKDICINVPRFNVMDNLSAEITKLSLNCFLTTKISFTNMIGDLATSVGANPEKILEAIGSDSRIGNKLMRYGFGYGGTCLPRDNRALAAFAEKHDMPIDISIASDIINQKHLEFQVSEFIKSNDKSNLVVLRHVSFKPESDIIEESQKLEYAARIAQSGYSVIIEDSVDVISAIKQEYGNLFRYSEI